MPYSEKKVFLHKGRGFFWFFEFGGAEGCCFFQETYLKKVLKIIYCVSETEKLFFFTVCYLSSTKRAYELHQKAETHQKLFFFENV